MFRYVAGRGRSWRDDRRLSVPDVLERMDEGLARRQPRDRSLQTELGHRIRPVQGASRSPASAIRSRSPTAPARRCGLRGRRRSPAPDTSMWSEVGDGIDYYFLYGPEIDRRDRRIPDADRAGVDAAGLGVRLLAVEEQVQHAGRGPRARWRSSGAARFPSTASCRTGSTGRRIDGATTSSRRRAIRIRTR